MMLFFLCAYSVCQNAAEEMHDFGPLAECHLNSTSLSNRSLSDRSVDKRILTDGTPDRAAEPGGLTIWMSGFSGSGKTTIAVEVVEQLRKEGIMAYRLDGDNLRKGLTSDLGFSDVGRHENNRRVSEVAKLFNDAGLVVICALICPFEKDRAKAREIHENDKKAFLEVFVDAPIEVVIHRDPKGLYKKALSGEIKEFTGISSDFEPPTHPDVWIKTDKQTVAESVTELLEAIKSKLSGLKKDS